MLLMRTMTAHFWCFLLSDVFYLKKKIIYVLLYVLLLDLVYKGEYLLRVFFLKYSRVCAV